MCAFCGIAFDSPSKLKLHAPECRRKSTSAASDDEVVAEKPLPDSQNGTTLSSVATHDQAIGTKMAPKTQGAKTTAPMNNKSILAELMTRNVAKVGLDLKKPKTSHSNYTNGPFQCPNCPKSFQSMSALQGQRYHCFQCLMCLDLSCLCTLKKGHLL